MIEIDTFVLGPLENNVYLLVEPESKAAVVIDPGYDSQVVVAEIQRRGLALQGMWITHAHFDHIAGIKAVQEGSKTHIPVMLNPLDRGTWEIPAWVGEYGMPVETLPDPDEPLHHGQILMLGREEVEVRHAPGHSAGHVMFYVKSAGALVCGDVIFNGSIGRTDLTGGDYDTLIRSIKEQVLSLPDDTRLLPGHGPETTVGDERRFNPFLH